MRTNGKTTQSWTFRPCTCGTPNPHGYFYDPGEKKRGDPFFSVASAMEAIEEEVQDGRLPVEEREPLSTQVRNSGLPGKIVILAVAEDFFDPPPPPER